MGYQQWPPPAEITPPLSVADGGTGAATAADARTNLGVSAGTPGVKTYRALLTQSSTDAPVATVLENSVGAVVWSRSGAGDYRLTLTAAFPANKVVPFTTAMDGGFGVGGGTPFGPGFGWNWISANVLQFITVDTGATPLDDMLAGYPVSFLVYP